MKIALVCDWLVGMRGGERCFEIACQLWPDADIYTLVHIPGSVSPSIEAHHIATSIIQKFPGYIEKFRRYLPLFPYAIERFDLTGYDVIVSFSHCVAKGVKVRPGIPHICYCHTPMRYAWDMRQSYLDSLPPIKKLLAGKILNRLKNWDRRTASGVTHFIANSNNTQKRILSAYGRNSAVIYPPVDCCRFNVSDRNDGFYLIVSAMVPYKRIDVAIEAFNNSKRGLLILGSGPELNKLKKMASGNIEFVTNASDKDVAAYMQNCKALIFPTEEDFGIVPLEAQACGKAVIA